MAGALSLAPGTLIGRDFRVLRPLAEGGMGAVYVAEQVSTGKQRALKVMLKQFVQDARNRERFALEARAGAHIASDHVVEVVGAGVDDATGLPWIAMELLEGVTLDDAVTQRGRLAPTETATVFEQLGHALAAAHAAGIVHRDLKPENIFLETPHRIGVPFTVKVLDFGIAKIIQENQLHSANTQMMGTPLWMAPEQTEAGRTISPATDVWALGLLVFWALTGTIYWRSATSPDASALSMIQEMLSEPIESASVRAVSFGVGQCLPSGFDAWFGRCVVRDETSRFADARVATAALLPLLAHVPTRAAPPIPPTLRGAPSPGWVAAPTLAAPISPPGPGLSRGWIVAIALAAVATLGSFVALVATSVSGSDATVTEGANPFHAGESWSGTYQCGVETNQVSLRIDDVQELLVHATFSFRTANGATTGAFTESGTYVPSTRHLTLSPVAWISQPPTYVAVGQDGTVSSDGQRYEGSMTHPSCGGFSTYRARAP